MLSAWPAASKHCYPTSLASLDVFSSLFPALAHLLSYSFHHQFPLPVLTYLPPPSHTSWRSRSCRPDAFLLWLLLAQPCTDEACVGVKWNIKELWLNQPAAAACPDHPASTLWLGSPLSPPHSLWLRKDKGNCWPVCVAAREECFPDDKWRGWMGGIAERHFWSFPYFAFSPHFLSCFISLPKGKLATGSLSFFSVMKDCWIWEQVVSVWDAACFRLITLPTLG